MPSRSSTLLYSYCYNSISSTGPLLFMGFQGNHTAPYRLPTYGRRNHLLQSRPVPRPVRIKHDPRASRGSACASVSAARRPRGSRYQGYISISVPVHRYAPHHNDSRAWIKRVIYFESGLQGYRSSCSQQPSTKLDFWDAWVPPGGWDGKSSETNGSLHLLMVRSFPPLSVDCVDQRHILILIWRKQASQLTAPPSSQVPTTHAWCRAFIVSTAISMRVPAHAAFVQRGCEVCM